MEKETITIYDVAREANVSMATVSRVVNGNPNVKPATRKKVLEVIERLDYRPNAVARGLASKRTTTVGVMLPDITNPYFAALAQGIDDIATMYDYNLIVANADPTYAKEIHVLNSLLAKQVDGVIYMGYHLSDELRSEMVRSRTPFVLAGTIDPQKALSSVTIDMVEAIKESVSRLIDNGNKRVAFVNGRYNNADKFYRLNGYQQALESKKVPYDDILVIETDLEYRSGEIILSQLQAIEATAVFVNDDETAIGILNAALEKGIKIPEQLEIMTSNNSKLTQMVRPQMSTIAPPLYDMGAVAMHLLTKIMQNKKMEQHEKLAVLPYKIEYRATTR